MKRIKIKEGGKLIGIFRYEVELSKGVYMAVSSISVKKNINKLKIELEKAKDGNLGVRYSKRGKCVIGTVNVIDGSVGCNVAQVLITGVSVSDINNIKGLHPDMYSILMGCVKHLESKQIKRVTIKKGVSLGRSESGSLKRVK